jgi:benzoate/toluate 1,2-dioxygenase beta subunit
MSATTDLPARTSAAFDIEDARQFLYQEARYLDDRDWDAWLALYAPDVEFWMPSWDDDDRQTEDPQTEISLIW